MFVLLVALQLSLSPVTFGNTALRKAACKGDVLRVSNIITIYDKQSLDLDTALLVASSYSQISVMMHLLKEGASDINGALMAGAINNKIQSVRYLIYHEQRFDDIDLSKAMRVAANAGAIDTEFLLLMKIKRSGF
jgi:hypothetical protein